MKHTEYKRICERSSTAILMIHGIAGTPRHFDEFISLIPESVSVYNLLLDGHGKGVLDFSKTSMRKWEKQVAAAVRELSASHKEIYIVAHSLGTLLAMEQALQVKKICKLFLLATPLAISLKPKMFVNAFKVYRGNINRDDDEAMAAEHCYGIERDRNLFHYLGWIPRYLELFAKIRDTRKQIGRLHTDCRVYQSRKDEVVSRRSLKYLKENPRISVAELENSGHYYYGKGDLDFLKVEFEEVLKEIE